MPLADSCRLSPVPAHRPRLQPTGRRLPASPLAYICWLTSARRTLQPTGRRLPASHRWAEGGRGLGRAAQLSFRSSAARDVLAQPRPQGSVWAAQLPSRSSTARELLAEPRPTGLAWAAQYRHNSILQTKAVEARTNGRQSPRRPMKGYFRLRRIASNPALSASRVAGSGTARR